jgi:hypothetical protein
MSIDILSVFVVLFDFIIISFLTWRVIDKNATLWGSSKIIYIYISLLTLYHSIIYVITLFHSTWQQVLMIDKYLHPLVFLFMLNPLLIAIIHWRGGRVL